MLSKEDEPPICLVRRAPWLGSRMAASHQDGFQNWLLACVDFSNTWLQAKACLAGTGRSTPTTHPWASYARLHLLLFILMP